MRHLIIAAHPRAKSFNHSVVESYTAALAQRGHQVACRDLYAMGFNPILSARDMIAIGRGKPARDIHTELGALRAADAITLISPLWWSGFPAMLKGYVDRVFSAAFADVIKGKDDRPSLSGKKGALNSFAEIASFKKCRITNHSSPNLSLRPSGVRNGKNLPTSPKAVENGVIAEIRISWIVSDIVNKNI